MTDFKTVMREYDRMCIKIIRCEECPIASKNNGRGVSCYLFMRQFPEEAERIILQWAKEHPVMTNGKKFEEIFGISGRDVVAINKLAWLDEEYEGGDGNDS